MFSRGPNRCLDDLRHRDPENSLEEADYACLQDTDQEQSTIQWENSVHHIPIPERKWKDTIAIEFSHKCTRKSQISKVVSELVRHESHRDRETDGAIHWMEAMISLTETGSIIERKQQNQIPSVPFEDTQEEK